MAADGSIIIDTRINTAGFSKGATNLKSQFGALGSSVKKLGGLIATAFSVTAIVNFAKEAIELGSDLQEVQNVVDVTFTTMNDQLNEFAESAAKSAGLSQTMAKQYAGTFGAMAKSFQFSEAEAYEMATTLTQLSGDVASFYNLTQDSAYTKLKSVFTGETESLKDLGVVMTQTALDDFALRKGLSKTTSEMTEQEKVALRYQFVLEQLSGASGDFVRTSDSWANQTRLLTLQFDQLKATVGQGLINALTPAVKAINTLLAKFQALANKFLDFTKAVFGDAGGASSALLETAESASELAESIEDAGKAAQKYLAPFDEITKIGSDTEDNTDSAASAIIDAISGGSVTVGAEIDDNVSPVLDRIISKLEELGNEIDFSRLSGSLQLLGSKFQGISDIITDSLAWAFDNLLVPLSQWAIEDLAPVSVEYLAEALDLLSESAKISAEGISTLFDSAQPAFSWLGDTAVMAVQKLTDRLKSWGEWLETENPKITEIIENLGEIISNIWTIAEPVLTSLRDYWGTVFDEITEKTQEKADKILSDLKSITDFMTGDLMKGLYNEIAGWINALMEVVVGGINNIIEAANTLSFTVPDWIPGIGGKTFGFNWDTITVPQLPYLAQGAVIPPNAPFAAILGDQKHGTNIEAPLETIQQAVAIVMEDMIQSNIAGHEATVAVLKEILEAVLGIHIGDDVIGQAVSRYNAEMAVIRGNRE